MLDLVKLGQAHKMKLRKEAIQYASTMADISINDGKSPHEKLFGIQHQNIVSISEELVT
jgi:hypothetical protein